ncbi:MAG: hypothetical protein CSA81_01510 [Acidobacteria bacterium]|nr:MAG: hypothetical protein CSA81_01510 [Acidobacteriota bacterium]
MIKTLFILACLASNLPVLSEDSHGEPASQTREEYKVLLVGDSWSYYLWIDSTMRELFADKGRPEVLEKGDETAISGSTAAEWTQPEMLQKITDELMIHPTIDVVQLSMGGNDFLAGAPDGWYTTMSFEEETFLYETILNYIDHVVQHIVSIDPEIKILLSGYDYPNFVDSLSGLAGFFCTPYWDGMVQPTPYEINIAMIAYEDMIRDYAETIPQLTYVRQLGSMQYLYGFPDSGIQPGELVPPGDINLPSPMESMRLGIDCFHLSSDGYDYYALNLWDEFYTYYFCVYQSEFLQFVTEWDQAKNISDLVLAVNRLCDE